ncbi:hypothetical protein Pelo_12219 [Pelomyxa schiedti]|nr:hypothetical protein Pelo_12219 [Pelomyxa schiedti]
MGDAEFDDFVRRLRELCGEDVGALGDGQLAALFTASSGDPDEASALYSSSVHPPPRRLHVPRPLLRRPNQPHVPSTFAPREHEDEEDSDSLSSSSYASTSDSFTSSSRSPSPPPTPLINAFDVLQVSGNSPWFGHPTWLQWVRRRHLSFTCSLHARLGCGSLLSSLPTAVIQDILFFDCHPSFPEQYTLFSFAQREVPAMVQNADRYLISCTWYANWLAHCQLKASANSAPVGLIDNNRLLDEENDIISSKMDGVDYVIVTPQAWEMLHIWHGGGPSICRRVIRRVGYFSSSLMLELRPKIVKITYHNTTWKVKMSKYSTGAQLLALAAEHFNLDVNTISSFYYTKSHRPSALLEEDRLDDFLEQEEVVIMEDPTKKPHKLP